jgi:hypothetical protein
MLATLRTELVRIHLELYRRGNETSEEDRLSVMHTGGTCHPAPYQFVYLRVRIANLSCASPSEFSFLIAWADCRALRVTVQPLVLTADTAVDPADHVIQEGVPSDVPIGRLETGGVHEFETPLCFVACGRFCIQVDARAVDGAARDAKVGSATLKVIVSEDNPR